MWEERSVANEFRAFVTCVPPLLKLGRNGVGIFLVLIFPSSTGISRDRHVR